MPEGVGYSSSNVTAGTGLSLNYVWRDVYAYSGSIDATDSTTPITMLKFTTGAKTQNQIFQFCGGVAYFLNKDMLDKLKC